MYSNRSGIITGQDGRDDWFTLEAEVIVVMFNSEGMTNVNLGSPEQHVWVQRCTALSNPRKGGVHHGIFKVKMGSFLCIVTVIFCQVRTCGS